MQCVAFLHAIEIWDVNFAVEGKLRRLGKLRSWQVEKLKVGRLDS
jgi:hypothetical protein